LRNEPEKREERQNNRNGQVELGRTKGGVARDLYLSPCQRDSHLELGSRASLHLRHLPCRPGRTDGETGANRHGIGYDGAPPSRNPCTMTGSTGTPHRPLSAETRLCTTYQGLARGADISVWANGGAPQIDLDPCGVHYIPCSPPKGGRMEKRTWKGIRSRGAFFSGEAPNRTRNLRATACSPGWRTNLCCPIPSAGRTVRLWLGGFVPAQGNSRAVCCSIVSISRRTGPRLSEECEGNARHFWADP